MIRRHAPHSVPLSDDPLWYKDAIIYELRVRSFMDSNDDGIGDFRGLTQKLDYLQDLGVTVLWLLPFYPSPGKDDGYDIADYFDVHPEVGSLDDFRHFLAEAHRRGLRVITELVINHTSDQHPWFQRARRAPKGSSHRNFYVWSDTPDRYAEARIIFKDFEHSNWAWDPVAGQYYWHRFYSHQPDLNFDNPDVHEAVFQVVDFWLGLGVDGLRLDAVPYLYEREGTNCENLPETHAFLRKLRRHIDEKFANRMLIAEANQWPEDAAAYFGDGDECHMNFHFPIMPRIFMAIHQEDRFPIVDILAQTPMLHERCQWALFLRNHDELTLEMVTDEERDYMYGAYAADPTARINLGIRRRLAPLVGNSRRRIELMNSLLLSLPGTPVLYYGDEIGMGDNIYLGDRNGVRTPMQWSPDRNAGFSRANPQRLILPVIIDPEYHYESVNVEAQQNNPSSLLWWTKRIIALRKRYRSFGRGGIEFLQPANHRVLAFIRRYGDEIILVVANLSRFVQYVELDLSAYAGMVPVELFGRTRFPPIGELPYLLTLSSHGFYWFELVRPRSAMQEARAAAYEAPTIRVEGAWQRVFEGEALEELLVALPEWLAGRPFFPGKQRIEAVEVREALPLSERAALVLLQVQQYARPADTWVVPLGFADREKGEEIRARSPQAVAAYLTVEGSAGGRAGVLFDLLADAESCLPLVEAVIGRIRVAGRSGELVGSCEAELAFEPARLRPRVLKAEQGNGAIAFGDELFFTLYRQLGDVMNPSLEVGRALLRTGGTEATPPLLGALEFGPRRQEPATVAVVHALVRAETDGRQYTREAVGRFLERILTEDRDAIPDPLPERSLVRLADREPPPGVALRMGPYLDAARQMARLVADVHVRFASIADDPAFAPEPYSAMDQRSTYQTMRNVTGRVLRSLRASLESLRPESRPVAQAILDQQQEIYDRFAPLLEKRLTAHRGRVHGNLNLARFLFTGREFVLIDFEGDRSKPLVERRRKRSPLRDLASMLRSFHRVAITALLDPAMVREGDQAVAAPWADLWGTWAAAVFLGSYLEAVGDIPFVPADRNELALLVDAFSIEHVLTELGQTLEDNPLRADVPLHALQLLLEAGPEAGRA